MKNLKILSASLLASLLVFAPTLWAEVPTPSEVAKLLENVSSEFNELEASFEAKDTSKAKKSLDLIGDILSDFRVMVGEAEKAIDSRKGGVATKKARDAARSVTEVGVDISEAMFALRTQHEDFLRSSHLEQDFEDMMVNEVRYPILQLAFSILRYKVDELSQVDGKVSHSDRIRRALKEVPRDLMSLAWFMQNRTTGEWIHTGWQNIQREFLVRDLIPEYLRLAETEVDEYNKNYDGDLEYDRKNHEERLGGFLLWLTDRAVNIRVERNSSEIYAAAFYGVIGAVTTYYLPLLVQFGENSYTMEGETAALVAIASSGVILAKLSSSSVFSTGKWIELNQFIRSRMASGLIKSTEIYLKKKFPTEYHPAQVPGWIRKRVAVRNFLRKMKVNLKSRCESLLSSFTGSEKKSNEKSNKSEKPKWGRDKAS